MHLFARAVLVGALSFLPASDLRAQAAADPSGHWEGTVEIPGDSLRFTVDLARNAKGEPIGAITAAETKDLPLNTIAVDGRSITFYARSDQPFHGQLSADGRSIAGDATLSGYTLPFRMTRTGDAHIEPPVTGRAIDKALEGRWQGALQADGRSMRLVLAIANQTG